MSIIQEALKRKAEEQPPPRAPVKTPLSARPSAATDPASTASVRQPHTVVILLTVLILVLVIAGALAATLFFLWNQTAHPTPGTAQIEEHAPVDREKALPRETTAVPADQPAEKPPVPTGQTTLPPQPVAESRPVEPAQEPRTTAPDSTMSDVEWPELRVSGIAVSDQRRLAWVNGQLLSEGRTIAGVRLVEIGDREVIFSLQGETRIIYLTE